MNQYVTGAVIHFHGVLLCPAEAYFVRIEHEMTKQHYISFIAAISSDRIQMVKLYPEGNAEARFKLNGVKEIFFYCNKDGLFCVKK